MSRLEVPMGPNEGLVFSPDGSGWSRYFAPVDPPPLLRLRFALDESDPAKPRMVIAELWLSPMAPRPLSARGLRDLPLGRIEAAANASQARDELVAMLRDSGAAVSVSVPYPADLTDPHDKLGMRWDAFRPGEMPALDLRLSVPTTRLKSDLFLAEVANLFGIASASTRRPAHDIADANGVPVTTVHGWVKEARRRGVDSPAALANLRHAELTRGWLPDDEPWDDEDENDG